VTYLFDNNISPRLARMLRELSVDARALREEFPQGVKDPEFLPRLKGTGWVFMTADTRITTRPVEAAALKESGVTALFLGPFWAKLTLWKQAAWIVGRWEEIDRFGSSAPRGTCAVLRQRGAPRPMTIDT
jgi:hypothetical protein